MTPLILYTTDDGRSQIKLRAKDRTAWLSQREMAHFFDVSTDNVGLHLKNIVAEGELLYAVTRKTHKKGLMQQLFPSLEEIEA